MGRGGKHLDAVAGEVVAEGVAELCLQFAGLLVHLRQADAGRLDGSLQGCDAPR